jgi:exopolysaccharide production protein ExoZ
VGIGLAAILVVITHSDYYVSEHMLAGHKYWNRGAAGVDLFFVLSGFVMIYSSTKILSAANGWKTFAERRLVRIVPIYWIATTIKLVALLAGSHYVLHARVDLLGIIESYLFIPTRNVDGELRPLLGVGWTLNFEMFFYLLFTLALRFRINVYIFVASFLIPLAILSAFVHPANAIAAFYLNPIILDFLFGMLIAGYLLRGGLLRTDVALVLLIGGLTTLLFIPLPEIPFVSASGVSAAMIILGAAALEPKLGWIPCWANFLGDASYVLYLFHPLIVPGVPVALKHLGPSYRVLSIVLSLSLAIVVATLIHKYLEKPLTDYLRNLFGAASATRSQRTVAQVPN